MNEETRLMLELISISSKLRAWCATAKDGPNLRAEIEGRLARECIIAEYNTGIPGALTDMVNSLLTILFDKVDWNAILTAAKTESGQLTLA